MRLTQPVALALFALARWQQQLAVRRQQRQSLACAAVSGAAVDQLRERLPEVLAAAGCSGGATELWGVRLGRSADAGGERALLAHFLRAREEDVDAAAAMLMSTIRWRRDEGVDRMDAGRDFPDFPPGLHLAGPHLAVMPLGKLLLEHYRNPRFARWAVCTHEATVRTFLSARGGGAACGGAAADTRGAAPPTLTLLIDARGLARHHFGVAARKCAAEVSRIFQDFYPDFLAQILIVNAPPLFSCGWALLRPFLPRRFTEMARPVSTRDVRLIEHFAECPADYDAPKPDATTPRRPQAPALPAT